MFGFLDGKEFYESIYHTSLWWLVTMAVICPLLVVAAVVLAVWIVGELREHFDLLRDDRTEGSYLVEASRVLACLAILLAIGGYFIYVRG